MLVTVCSWCDKTLSIHTVRERMLAEREGRISHGMCRPCEVEFERKGREAIKNG